MNFRRKRSRGNVRTMKASAFAVVSLVAVLMAGCVQAPLTASLEHNGTPSLSGNKQEQGSLMVFSAYDVVPFAASELYTEAKYHSDYEISGEGGFTLKVKNRDRAVDAPPTRVRLAPGRYQVIAKANGFGRIAVPIAIEPGLTTTLHLEGPPAATGTSVAAGYDLVRIAGGRVVGWCILDGSNRAR